MKKQIPKFRNEAEEAKFWSKQDSAEYVDWSKAKRAVFPRLKPSSKTISLRLPDIMLSELKMLANKRDVPYQSLMKTYIAEMIAKELKNRNVRCD